MVHVDEFAWAGFCCVVWCESAFDEFVYFSMSHHDKCVWELQELIDELVLFECVDSVLDAALDLCGREWCDVAVAGEADVVSVVVDTFDACWYFFGVASRFDGAVEADDDIVSDFAPAAVSVPLVDLCGCCVECDSVFPVCGCVPHDSFDFAHDLLPFFYIVPNA